MLVIQRGGGVPSVGRFAEATETEAHSRRLLTMLSTPAG
jgi:hypothetical protein